MGIRRALASENPNCRPPILGRGRLASAPPHVQCVAEVGYSTGAEHTPFANCHRRRIVNVMGRLGDRKL